VKGVARPLAAALIASLLLPAVPAHSDDEPSGTEEPAGSKGNEAEKKKPQAHSDVVAKVSTEVSEYSDSDGVTVSTPTIGASLENPISEWSLGGRYLVDVVSAASVDIVATASRRWREVRQAGNFDGSFKLGDVGLAGSGSFDFFEKNVTTLLGYAYGHDTIGIHRTPFSAFSHNVDSHAINAALTVVVNRSTLLALVGDVIIESGDSSKPYRYIPMFSASEAPRIPAGATIDSVNQDRLPIRPLEQLPLKRDRFAVTARLAHRFSSSTLRIEERFYQDTWGLTATSTDLRYIVDLGRRVSFWPHARLHLQAPVTFWKRAYVADYTPGGAFVVPALRTGDRELGPLRAITGGGGININVGSDKNPSAWAIGLRGDAIWTGFLDDLYIKDRVSGFGAFTLDAVFE
jgi:Protein of unknown function (DUF3570)